MGGAKASFRGGELHAAGVGVWSGIPARGRGRTWVRERARGVDCWVECWCRVVRPSGRLIPRMSEAATAGPRGPGRGAPHGLRLLQPSPGNLCMRWSLPGRTMLAADVTPSANAPGVPTPPTPYLLEYLHRRRHTFWSTWAADTAAAGTLSPPTPRSSRNLDDLRRRSTCF